MTWPGDVGTRGCAGRTTIPDVGTGQRKNQGVSNGIPDPKNIYIYIYSGYTYMAVWVGGLEVWEIRVMCKIDLKKFSFVCFVFVLFLFN